MCKCEFRMEFDGMCDRERETRLVLVFCSADDLYMICQVIDLNLCESILLFDPIVQKFNLEISQNKDMIYYYELN